jgi:translation initiation factor IF-2
LAGRKTAQYRPIIVSLERGSGARRLESDYREPRLSKVRLYQLAHELNVDSKDLAEKLRAVGCDVRNHMSTVDDSVRQIAMDLVSGRRPAAAPPAPEPAKPARPAPAAAPIPDPKGKRVAAIGGNKRAGLTDEELDITSAETHEAGPEVEVEAAPEPAPEPVVETIVETFVEPAVEPVVAVAPEPAPVPAPAPAPKPTPVPTKATAPREIKTIRGKKPATAEAAPVEPAPVVDEARAKPEVVAAEPAPEVKVEPEPAQKPPAPLKAEEPSASPPVAEEPPAVAAVEPAPAPKPVPVPAKPPGPIPTRPSGPATIRTAPRPSAGGPAPAPLQRPGQGASQQPTGLARPGQSAPGPGLARPGQSAGPQGRAGAGPGAAPPAKPGLSIRDIRNQRSQRPAIRPPGSPAGPLGQPQGFGQIQPPRPKPAEGPVMRPTVSAKDMLSGNFRAPGMAPPPGIRPGMPIPPGAPPFGSPRPGEPQRRGVHGRGGPHEESEEDRKKRLLKPGRERGRVRLDDDDDGEYRRGGRRGGKSRQAIPSVRHTGPVELDLPVTVRSFSETTGIRSNDLLRKLMAQGVMANINAILTEEQAQLLGLEYNLEIKLVKEQDVESEVAAVLDMVDPEETLVPRSPVVTIMGHVDHGKTSLLDRIRKANVAGGEAGGITQHIGAYQVLHEKGDVITFLDTPGHEAFTAMRARGANVTDVVILVVAAEDGVMPQTEEAINHAKAAGVPIVVAMNKIDLPGAKPDRIQQQLSKFGLVAEAWGGDTLMVGTSALTGVGISDLLESVMIVSELKDLKANPDRPAIGSCVEAQLTEGRGVVATLLVSKGTLRKGDAIVCGNGFGRIRAMYNHLGEPVEEAGPSMPVQVSGLDVVPDAGERFAVLEDVSLAREVAENRRAHARALDRAQRQKVTLETILESVKGTKVQELLLILKADVRGSIEAIRKELSDLDHAEVKVRIIHEGIGAISESDVLLADASDAIVVGFNVVADDRANNLAQSKGVEIRKYEIIYQLSDDIKKALEGMLKPETKEVVLGRAVIQKVFNISKVGSIAGCRVVSGTIERAGKCRIIRDGTIIGTYPIETLRRVKDDVREVREGLECGIKLEKYDSVKPEDVLECFKIEEIKRTL